MPDARGTVVFRAFLVIFSHYLFMKADFFIFFLQRVDIHLKITKNSKSLTTLT